MEGVSFIKGKLYTIDEQGIPDTVITPEEINYQTEKPLVVMVHGYQFDPRLKNLDNPHWDTYEKNNHKEDSNVVYPRWGRELMQAPTADLPVFGFGWYSVAGGLGAIFSKRWRQGLRSIFESWLNGFWNTYLYAWHLAEQASMALVETLLALNSPVNIVCHSLGTRVVIQALKHPKFLEALQDPEHPLNLRRVILLNGAEFEGQARSAGEAISDKAQFFNIVVKTDAVLDLLGENAAPDAFEKGDVIGHDGIKRDRPSNWTDIILDDPKVQEWGKENGYEDLQGDNPKNIADHWYSHKHSPNWKLYRDILAGEEINPPQDLC